MKKYRFSLLAAAVMAASFAFADAENILIAFSTVGPDTYADGETTVLDGERYALVWSQGEFGGFNAKGEAAVAGDKVICYAPAKGGRCELFLFQVDKNEVPAGGKFSVYLLDTRVASNKLGEDMVVTGAAAVKSYVKSSDRFASMTEDATEGGAKTVATSSASLAGDLTEIKPVISDFKLIDNDKVNIYVTNLFPGLTYSVKGGLGRDAALDAEVDASESSATFILDKDSASFFSIEAK